ncbi:MAG TPA: hypothetical protein VGD90_12190, partial [Sphingobacteriaceae bacterium]
YPKGYPLPSLEDYELLKPWTVYNGAVSDFSRNASPFSSDQSFGATKLLKDRRIALNNDLVQ